MRRDKPGDLRASDTFPPFFCLFSPLNLIANTVSDRTLQIFTLFDTYNLEVTTFEAVRPPNVLLFCGSERGKQQAVGCSYD